MKAMQIEVWVTDDDAAALDAMRQRLEELTGGTYTAAKALELAMNKGSVIDAAITEQKRLLDLP